MFGLWNYSVDIQFTSFKSYKLNVLIEVKQLCELMTNQPASIK